MRGVPTLLGVVALVAAPLACAQYAAQDFSLRQCGGESLFRSGVEAAEIAGVVASGGAGGALGEIELQVLVPDTGRSHAMLLYVPEHYTDATAAPLVVALHGTAGSAAAAPGQAAAARNLWRGVADRDGVLVLAPIASGNQGGWVPTLDTPALACALALVERSYSVDRRRRALWGFSSGGHFAHALALGNSTRFAAYAVNAGVLHALACEPAGGTYDCATTLPQVVRRVPASLRVGSYDSGLSPYVTGDVTRLQQAGWQLGADLSYGQFVGGHTAGTYEIERAWEWIGPRRLP